MAKNAGNQGRQNYKSYFEKNGHIGALDRKNLDRRVETKNNT